MIYPLDVMTAKILDDATDPETGELAIPDEELSKQLTDAAIDFDDQIDRIISGVKNLRADVLAIDAEINALTERKKRTQKKADSLADFAAYLLNGQKWHNQRHDVKFRKSAKVEVDDSFVAWAKENRPELLTFKPAPEPTANKKTIGQALKDGEQIQHAIITESNNIQIK